jgi:lysophospholipase
MIGAATAALNFWYIEDMSNGTLAPFAKRSVDKRTPTKSTKHHGAEVSKSLKKRDGLFPLATLEELIDAFEEFFDLNYTQIAYGQFPNPFPSIDTETLMTVDGSESGGGIPVWPQIQPARKSDFIIAWDGSTDAIPFGWQNGTNLHNTYIQAKADGIPFPVIPPASTFVKNNYTTKPVFFGCDAELTTTNSVESPIILYIANAPYSAFTNYSFFQDDFSFTQMHEIYTNGFNQVTQGNGTLDKEWPACLGCAAIDRSLAKVGMSRTAQCDQCFEKYCWDGTVYDGEVGIVDLSLVLDPSLSFAEWLTTNPF